MTAIVVADLTQSTLEGMGVFDVLMRANKAHLEAEFSKNRIKGTEYSTVYLGSLEASMRTALEFLMQKQRIELEAQLLAQQIILAQVEVQKANAELAIIQANLDKIPTEIAHIEAQTSLIGQQKLNLVSEELAIDAKTAFTEQQTTNLVAEALNTPKQGLVLDGQKCKLDAEYDMILGQTLKGASETSLLAQKLLTEKAQTTSLGVDSDSVIGKQKALYGAQTDGFSRDAEQKAAKLLVDTWNVRRTTDEGTVADSTNKLSDAEVGRAVTKMLAGVGA